MKRAALVQPRERQKVQTVSCPCCEARLALHFINGENAVYDVTLLGTTVDSQPHDGKLSRMEAAGQDFKDGTTAHRVHDEKDSGIEVQAHILETSATDTPLDNEEMREIQPEKSRPEEASSVIRFVLIRRGGWIGTHAGQEAFVSTVYRENEWRRSWKFQALFAILPI